MVEVLEAHIDEICGSGGPKGSKIIKGEILFGKDEMQDALTILTSKYGKVVPDPYRKPFSINIFNIRDWNDGQKKLYALNTEADFLGTFTVSVEV